MAFPSEVKAGDFAPATDPLPSQSGWDFIGCLWKCVFPSYAPAGATGVSLAAAQWEIGTSEWAFPWGIVFLEWRPCGDEKQWAKPLTDAVITWRTQAYRECDAPSVISLKEREGQDPLQTHQGCKQTNNALNREWTALRLTMIEHAQMPKPAHNAAGHDTNGNGFWTYSRTHTVKFGC